jgi:hypothetical protein
MVVNLQLTQKDPVQSKIDKARRTSHTHEVRHRFPTVTPTAQSERSFATAVSHHQPHPSPFSCSVFLVRIIFSFLARLLTMGFDSRQTRG